MAMILLIIFFIPISSEQFAGSSDRTQQELNLLDWTSGIRIAYCQSTPITELVNPFREAVARMANRFCRNATACRLKKSVTFTKHQVVLLDGFPRRENRALNFRFFIVFPHEAVPLDKKTEKPLLTQKTLSDVLKTQLSEFSHGLGWQILSHEKYPRFDPITTFMNRAMIPIFVISLICMLFLAYWSSSITSGSSLYSGGGWMVTGSSGGKNAALRRTLEIIAEQKLRFDTRKFSMHSMGSASPRKQAFIVYKSNARLQAHAAPPRSLATSSAVDYAKEQRAAPLTRQKANRSAIAKDEKLPQIRSLASAGQEHQQQRRTSTSTRNSTETTNSSSSVGYKSSITTLYSGKNTGRLTGNATYFPSSEQPSALSIEQPLQSASSEVPSSFRARLESLDVVPELIVMNQRNESMDTTDTYGGRKVSLQGHRRHSRRFSVSDEFKRKKPTFGGGTGGGGRPKRWKTGSLMFSRFSFRRPK